MTAGSSSSFHARVQGKDVEAFGMQVNLQTTVGEMLRVGGTNAEGRFTIDISPVPQRELSSRTDNSSREDVRPAKKARREDAQSSRADLASDHDGSLAMRPTSGASRSAINISDEIEVVAEIERAVAQPTENVKLDPKAGCRIDIHFSDGRKIPMHILETTPIEKIATSACKALKIPLEGMTFTFERERYQPFALATPAVYSKEGVLVKKAAWLWDMLASKEKATAEHWALKAKSVIVATIHKDAPYTPEQPAPQPGRIKCWTEGGRAQPTEGLRKGQFNMQVRTLTGRYYYLKVWPYSRSEDICRAVCNMEGVPFEQARFLHENRSISPPYIRVRQHDEVPDDELAVMLIRDREACNKTAEEWGLAEGSTLYMILCLCGC